MTDDTRAPFVMNSAFARLSSGTKMMFIMCAALLPLGAIALLAALQYTHSKRVQHLADARLVATSQARQLDLVVYRAAGVLRLASGAVSADGSRCAQAIAGSLRLLPAGTRVAFFSPTGDLRCATAGFDTQGVAAPRRSLGAELQILERRGLRFSARSENRSFGVGELAPAAVRGVLEEDGESAGVTLRQGDTSLEIAPPAASRAFSRPVASEASLGGGQLRLMSTSIVESVTPLEVLLVALPLLMWGTATVIAWVVVQQLLLRPLARLQESVAQAAAFGSDTREFVVPRLQTPAREIRTLAEAYAAASGQIAQREHRLEESLKNQVLLTREVHHRVKNNLQVVASLINLHARGTTGEVSSAYASIQRRVDALAVVHRNHYAELEKHNGVSLRSLVAELTANLRATAPAGADHFTITLTMVDAPISQDTAVPIAFLITELIEFLMQRSPAGGARICLQPAEDPVRAFLTIESPELSTLASATGNGLERVGRIIAGLARQLRAPLSFIPDPARYEIAVPILLPAKE